MHSTLSRYIFLALSIFTQSLKAEVDAMAVFEDWSKTCETIQGEELCHIYQTITSRENNQQILHATLGYLSGHPDIVMVLTVPLGVSLPHGLKLQIDQTESVHYQYLFCHDAGCVVRFSITDSYFQALKRGKELRVSMVDLNSQNVLTASMSLMGISAGLQSLQ